GADEPDGKQGRGEVPGERGEGDGGVRSILDVRVAAIERLRAGDDDEEADDAGRNGSDDDVDALELPVAGLQLLVDRIGLDEREPPGRERGSEGRRCDEQRMALEREIRDREPSRGLSPMRVREDA